MATGPAGVRLTIFMTEDDRESHRPLHEVLLDEARRRGMAGATVWRGVEGFGRSRHLRTTRFPDVARGLPLMVELVDLAERIDAFIEVLGELAPGSLVIRQAVTLAGHPPRPDGSG